MYFYRRFKITQPPRMLKKNTVRCTTCLLQQYKEINTTRTGNLYICDSDPLLPLFFSQKYYVINTVLYIYPYVCNEFDKQGEARASFFKGTVLRDFRHYSILNPTQDPHEHQKQFCEHDYTAPNS